MTYYVLTALLTTLALASIAYRLVSLVAAIRFFSRADKPSSPIPPPPVSVMIPLCGVDFEAYENYLSFCRQEYPEFQLVFGVQDPGDSSVEVVRRLMAECPDRDIELVIGSETIGHNPKVNNLHNMSRRVKHDIIVLADSDIRVEPDYLSSVAEQLDDDRVGLVTCFYRAGAAPSLGAKIEAVGITGDFASGVLVANQLEGMSFALGATIGVKRKVLESIGGFKAVADYLADDYMLGNLVWKAGCQVRLSRHVVQTVLHPVSIASMITHQVRWARGIRACRPRGHFGSIVTYGTALACLNVLVCSTSLPSLLLLASVLSVRLCSAWFVGVRCLGDDILRRNILLVPIADILGFVVWCLGIRGRNVVWRGKTFHLDRDGKIVPAG